MEISVSRGETQAYHSGLIRIGTAGWAIPRAYVSCFPTTGSGLERYASSLSATEINSSFYKPHRPGTYERWAAAVPADFRFSVKLPRLITHERRLIDSDADLGAFLGGVNHLGGKLGALLVQLPPSLVFDAPIVGAFLEALRRRTCGPIACEPRHQSWFEPEADDLLSQHRIARVAADPARIPEAAHPGGWPGLRYYRLHGSPRIYLSEYPTSILTELADTLSVSRAAETWCIFDNTTLGAATGNALSVTASARSALGGEPLLENSLP